MSTPVYPKLTATEAMLTVAGALGACQCFAYAAHLQHTELVDEAFNLICQQRKRTSKPSWKQAQQQAAINLRNALLTERTRYAA
jgi:hypothetical protein